MNNNKIKVMIVEDDCDFVYLVKQLLSNEPEFEFVGWVDNKKSALELAINTKVDIVLIDLNLSNGDLDGILVARELRINTNCKVIILSAFEDCETVLKASAQSFATSYVFKSNYFSIVSNLKEVAYGRCPMKFFIDRQIFSNLSNAEIAIFDIMLGKGTDLKSSPKTIANQKTKIFEKLGVRSQKELVHIFSYYSSK